MLTDICIKFREYSLSGFQVIERTRCSKGKNSKSIKKAQLPFFHGFCDAQSTKGNNSKSIEGSVSILALCTSSHAD